MGTYRRVTFSGPSVVVVVVIIIINIITPWSRVLPEKLKCPKPLKPCMHLSSPPFVPHVLNKYNSNNNNKCNASHNVPTVSLSVRLLCVRACVCVEITAVCSQVHTKHTKTLRGQNVALVKVQRGVHKVTTGLVRVDITWSGG